MIIHLTSFSDMTDNKKAGGWPPGEKTKPQVVEKDLNKYGPVLAT